MNLYNHICRIFPLTLDTVKIYRTQQPDQDRWIYMGRASSQSLAEINKLHKLLTTTIN